MKGKRRRTKKKRVSFSKLLLLLESGIVLYTTYEGFALAKFAVASGFMGTLPWIATMVTAAWGAYGTSAACYYAKAKAENTAGGVTYETVCRTKRCAAGRIARGEGMELLKKRLANLLSVKSLVTICLTVTFCVLTVQTKVTQEFNTVYLMVIAFYFGTQNGKTQEEN